METETTETVETRTETAFRRVFGHDAPFEHMFEGDTHTFRGYVFSCFDVDMKRLLRELEAVYGSEPCIVIYCSDQRSKWNGMLLEVKWYHFTSM